MRYLIPLLTACSGLVIVTIGVSTGIQAASATTVQKVAPVAAANWDASQIASAEHKTLCSRRPLPVSADGTKLMALSPNQNWTANIVKLFCRDVRINTIVVRDYCALVRE